MDPQLVDVILRGGSLQPHLNSLGVLDLPSDSNIVLDDSPAPSVSSPHDKLTAIIEADRHRPGQKALFAAIDALKPELTYEDAMEGLRLSYQALRETLQEALDDPKHIQSHYHVKKKLQAQLDDLTMEVPLEDEIMDNLIMVIKEWVGQRWQVEATGELAGGF